jgi:hypothetical protein
MTSSVPAATILGPAAAHECTLGCSEKTADKANVRLYISAGSSCLFTSGSWPVGCFLPDTYIQKLAIKELPREVRHASKRINKVSQFVDVDAVTLPARNISFLHYALNTGIQFR